MRYYQVEISVNKMKSILQILPKQIVLFFHYVCPSVCTAEVDPYFERKRITFSGVAKTEATIWTLEQNPPERMFEIYMGGNLLTVQHM